MIKGGKKSNEDTASVFLLGKELAYDTARGQVRSLMRIQLQYSY